jgi:hypothetical protein
MARQKQPAMSGHRPGGGLHSNKVVRKPVLTGAARTGITPGHAGQIGSALGNHGTEIGKLPEHKIVAPREVPALNEPVPWGNQLCNNVGKGGPGTGRTVHAHGSQGAHGRPAPGNPVPRRDPFEGLLNKRGQ